MERELFPHSTNDTERSLHHDQAKMAMRACASMKQLDQVGRIEEDTARAAGSAMKQRVSVAMPGTHEGTRTRRGAVTDGDVEMGVDTRTEAQGGSNQQVDHMHGTESVGRSTTHDAGAAGMSPGVNSGGGTDQQPDHSSQPSPFREELLLMLQAESGTRGLKRQLHLEMDVGIENAAKQATYPSRARALASVQRQQAGFEGWVQSEVAAAQKLNSAASMATAVISAAKAVITSLPGAASPTLAANACALLLAAGKVHASLNAGANEHVVRGYTAAAAAKEVGATAERAVDGAMDETSQLLAMALAAVNGQPPRAPDAAEMAVEEPEWLREAAEAVGVGVPVLTRQTSIDEAACLTLQCHWRRHRARTASAAADAAREERKRAARERLRLREAEERVKREAKAARRQTKRRPVSLPKGHAVAEQRPGRGEHEATRHGSAQPVLRLALAVAQLQVAWRNRRKRRELALVKLQTAWRLHTPQRAAATAPHAAPLGTYIVPAALGQTRLVSTMWRTEAATQVQAAWRRCLRRRDARNTRWARLVAEADADVARRLALQEERAAAVKQRVATVRAFRQLEVDLRAQGIRAVGGAASGGRQRSRLREQRRREGIAERLWQQTMGM